MIRNFEIRFSEEIMFKHTVESGSDRV
jgi:hypothetical protein